jgi:crotonobetainyl-CoA:carnitine CoA-transferase CaiB-like acyl-CoA transferase
MGNNHPSIVPYRVFAVADGHVIVNCGNDGQFSRLCGAVGKPEMAEDQRFKTNEARCENRELTDQILADILIDYERQPLITLLEGVNVPCGPINDIPAIFADPHLQHRQMEVQLSREDGSSFNGVAYPPKLSKTPARYASPPPELGAHNKEVLKEWGVR